MNSYTNVTKVYFYNRITYSENVIGITIGVNNYY